MRAVALRPDERVLAAANHVSSAFFPFVGPIVFLVVGLFTSRFVAYHARVALTEAVVFKLAVFGVGAASLVLTLVKVAEIVATNGASFTWDLVWQAALKFVVLWLAFLVANFVLAVRSLFQARDAFLGKAGKGFSPLPASK